MITSLSSLGSGASARPALPEACSVRSAAASIRPGVLTPGRARLRWERARRLPPWPRWAVGVGLFWVGLSGLATLVARSAGYPGTLCWFKAVTGVPCPTCGLGRGVQHLAAGDPGGALALNPLLFAVLAGAAVLLVVRAITGLSLRLEIPAGLRTRGLLLALGALALNWIYLIWTGV